MNVNNIRTEVFSGFSARFKRVQDMELEYMHKHWDSLKASDSEGKAATLAV